MILVGDVRERLSDVEDESIQCIATSTPYFGLRKYGGSQDVEIGAEPTLDAFIAGIVDVLGRCRKKLRPDGVAWANVGDSFEDGTPLLVPLRIAQALQADGWFLRAMLPWVKFAGMPESVQSRPCISHEYVLFLTRRQGHLRVRDDGSLARGYFYDADAVRVPGSENTNPCTPMRRAPVGDKYSGVGNGHDGIRRGLNPAGRSLRSSDVWRAGARDAGHKLLAAAEGKAVGLITDDDSPVAFALNPKGSGIDHFAMWPVRLVAPMIKAGTPEAGSCSVCGAPWVRVVEREKGDEEALNRPKHLQSRRSTLSIPNGRAGWEDRGTTVRTLGFRPSCAHQALPRPALVLDPFAGAGTTLAVAECLGREGIGIELYQKHADLYPERRAIVAQEMAEESAEAAEIRAAVESEELGQLDMFARQP